jgi:hypothetical protein
MKSFLLVWGLLFTLSAQAINFECSGENLTFSYHLQAKVMVKGSLETSPYRIRLTNYKISYDIKIGSIPFASFESQTIKPLKHRLNYQPTVYLNHFRFDFSHMIELGDGSLIIPYLVFEDDILEFKAFTMLTGIEDHAGGTVPMNCVKTF